MNSDLSDIATALTQSLSTTGVSSMTGPIKGAAGSVAAPSYSFSSDTDTGWYLAGTNTIGLALGGAVALTVSSTVITYSGALSITGTLTTGKLVVTGTASVGGTLDISGDVTGLGASNSFGNSSSIFNINAGGVVIATASIKLSNKYIDVGSITAPASAAANNIRIYVAERSINTVPVPFAKDQNGTEYPLGGLSTQCQLVLDGTNLRLNPYGGNLLSINGIPQVIPNTGVSLAASNSAGVFVYIYAFMNGATMTLEMSTTAPAIQTGTGIQQKTGDSSRTLVGAAYTDTAGAWADTNGKLWTLSYYNRRVKSSRIAMTVSYATASVNYQQIASLATNFISWGNENTDVKANIVFTSNGSVFYVQAQTETAAVIDSAAGRTPTANQNIGSAITSKISGVTEAANHQVLMFARMEAATGTLTVYASGTFGETTSLIIYQRG